MRTLYVRIIVMTMLIMIVSAFIAFIVTNGYYQYYLKPLNDEKVTHIAENVVSVFEENDYEDISSYLLSMTDLGYKFHLVDPSGEEKTYGEQFKVNNLDPIEVANVLEGNMYHGIAAFPWKLLVTGFFDDELKNTIGIPIQIQSETHALFVRPNTPQQFGEMRTFLAVLLLFVLLFSFLLVLTSTRFIVNPIRKLTEATRKIAAGNYHIKLNVNRKDEIGRLANDFSKMSNILEYTEEKRQEFVSSVSHEIQSPLTSIQGFSQALREQELKEEDRVRYLAIIEKESRRLSLLSKQLLTLSFLDSEMDEDGKVSYDLLKQLKEVVSATEWQWREKGITIQLDASPTNIVGDPRLLHQVWMNLLTNAIRYTNAEGTISLRVINKKESVNVEVIDTGIGIKEQDIAQIFNRFYKADKSRERTNTTSSGLGLAIVKKVIELHNGTIMVESEHGKGSTFKVSIPRK